MAGKITNINQAGEEIVRAESEKAKPLRGRGGKANFPSSKAGLIQTDEDRMLVSRLLTETLREYKQPKVKSDDELRDRLNDYFKRCAESGQIPTVEEMAMCTGYTQATVWDWEMGRNHGFSGSTSEIIKKAKEFLKTFDAKLVISGKLNFLAYCFRAKNYYGMSDKTEYVLTPNTKFDSDYSEEDMKRRYMIDDGSEVETTLED